MGLITGLFRRISRATIKTKFAVFVTIMIGGISLFIVTYFPAVQEQDGLSDIRDKALSLLDTAAFSISPAVFFEDEEAAEKVIEGLKLNKDLAYFVVEDGQGRRFAAFNAGSRAWTEAEESEKNRVGVAAGGDVFRAAKEIVFNGQVIGTAYIGLKLDDLRRELDEARATIIIVSMAILILSMVAINVGGSIITKPLSRMVQAAERISEGDLSHRAEVPGTREVAGLAVAFNRMVANLDKTYRELEEANRYLEERVRERTEEALQKQAQLVHADKMATLGTLVSGIAHEINNPNLFVKSNAAILAKVLRSARPILESYYEEHGDFKLGGIPYSRMREQIPEMVDGIMDGCERINNIVSELREFAGRDSPEMTEAVDLNEVVKAALNITSGLINDATDNLHVEYAQGLPEIRGNFQRLEQVVINLLTNAAQALRNKREGISVTTEYREADEGVGISEENLRLIFDPFFTTKREAGGTGLGLSISLGIVQEHGGTLKFSSTEGEGTTASLSIPVGDKTLQ